MNDLAGFNFEKLKGLVIDMRPGDVVIVNEDLKIQMLPHKSSNGISIVFSGPKDKYRISRDMKYKKARDE